MRLLPASAPATLLATAAAAVLVGCGGGGLDDPGPGEARPSFHLAQVLPPEPGNLDADGSAASARQAAASIAGQDDGDTAQVPAEDMRKRILSNGPRATATTIITYYTPAQIRAAYGVDRLGTSAAAQGSGQTIAIIGAYHNATAAADLATFSTKFGLAGCSALSVTSTTLAKPAAGSGCSFGVVYSTAAAGVTATAPATNSGWATETALDVQWAHAIAPMARILLIEAASASSSDLLGAVTLAGKLGASVVSMSWGASEFSSQANYDRYFTGSGITYLAASGDAGRGVEWPAVSANVIAVGGTSLTASGSTRTETAWSGSGGGISAYSAAPAWQSATIKVTATNGTVAAPTRRSVPDVAFNANASTGQLIVVNGTWYVAGGTSLATPQWAGLTAVANAQRAAAGKASLGQLANSLYRGVASNASAWLDITSGNNGTCTGCAAISGYDLVTGFGTPQAPAITSWLGTF